MLLMYYSGLSRLLTYVGQLIASRGANTIYINLVVKWFHKPFAEWLWNKVNGLQSVSSGRCSPSSIVWSCAGCLRSHGNNSSTINVFNQFVDA